jgi:hypothetical protein
MLNKKVDFMRLITMKKKGKNKKILDQVDKREKIYKELTSKYNDIYIYEYRSRLQTFITQEMIQSVTPPAR